MSKYVKGKLGEKQKILKAAREKGQGTFQGAMIRLKADCLSVGRLNTD